MPTFPLSSEILTWLVHAHFKSAFRLLFYQFYCLLSYCDQPPDQQFNSEGNTIVVLGTTFAPSSASLPSLLVWRRS